MPLNWKKLAKINWWWPLLLVADFYTKLYARDLGQFQANSGISLGALSYASDWLVVLIVLVLLFIWRRYQGLASRLVLIGGLANLVDRLAHGAITDWLNWPKVGLWFNLADIYINLGVGLIIIGLLFNRQRQNYEGNAENNF